MAKHERGTQDKQADLDKKHRKRQPESQASVDQSLTWDTGPYSLKETPFTPRMNEHAETLSRIPFTAQRYEFIMRLNNTYGYRYAQRLVESVNAQAKLTVSDPNDVYEQEADRVAEEVTRSINTPVQRQVPEEEEEIQEKPLDSVQRQDEEEEEVQEKPFKSVQRQAPDEEELQAQEDDEELQAKTTEREASSVATDVETRINNARGGGQPLSDEVKTPMERAFGADFGSVRTHIDSEADTLNRELSAKAFTTGQDVFFREGEYSPGSDGGKRLIAHELTHVVQQAGVKNIRGQEPDQGKPAVTGNEGIRAFTIQRNGGSKWWKALKAAGIMVWGLADFIGVTNRIRSYLLQKKFKVKISGGKIFPFSNFMLSAIDDVLSALPLEHLTKNSKLKAIKGAGPLDWQGAAFYDPDSQEIELHRFHIPSWLYLAFSKSDAVVRDMIDKARMGELPQDAQSKQALNQLYLDAGIQASPISVMGSDVANESLFKWQLRHEIGHSVDKEIGFAENYANEDKFGGWMYWQSDDDLQNLAEMFLDKTGVDDQTIPIVSNSFKGHLSGRNDQLIELAYWNLQPAIDDAEKPKLILAAKYINLARMEPWLRNDGGGEATMMVTMRIQFDSEEDKWCSYKDEARQFKVSNYQFMNKAEWFAEAYAAYYGPDQNKLSADVQTWFQNTLPGIFGGKAAFRSWKDKRVPQEE